MPFKFRRQSHKGADPIGCTHPNTTTEEVDRVVADEWGRRKANHKTIITYRKYCTWCGKMLREWWEELG